MTLEEAKKVVLGQKIYYSGGYNHVYVGRVCKIIKEHDIDNNIRDINFYVSISYRGTYMLNHAYLATEANVLEEQFERWFLFNHEDKKLDIKTKSLMQNAYMAGIANS